MYELLNGSANQIRGADAKCIQVPHNTMAGAPPRAHLSPSAVAATSSVALALLSGCEAIGTIFKAGFWVGIIAVVAVIGLIVFGVTKLRT
jgi:hypothetical protein